MKKYVVLSLAVVLFASCVPQKEVKQPPKETKVLPPPVVPETKPEPLPPPKKYEKVLTCEEKTEHFFNKSGIEVLPFVRLAFFDLDNDGKQELVAGSKDGTLRLYKRVSTGQSQKWEYVSNYFAGIRVGAFASPAVGDLDQDGNPEIIVGTGGFSSDSGRVLVYRNTGSLKMPVWEKAEMPVIDVGDDATPALLDVNGNGKGKPDLIVGNSTGDLFLYKNTSRQGRISFTRDGDYFRGINLGMYVMPATVTVNGRAIIIAGNSMGKLYLLERSQNGKGSWQKTTLKLALSSFAAPAFMQGTEGLYDLIVSESNGQIHHYVNTHADYRDWDERATYFAGRIMPGPVCTPAVTKINGKSCMVTGNVNGELKLFEYDALSPALPWIERAHFFKGIKLSSFSRGVVTTWQDTYLLITGQQDGFVRAFLNTGTPEHPVWKEQKDFFRGLPKIDHASPTVFDLDGDGMWELIIGDVDGNVTGYRMEQIQGGRPSWKRIEGVFTGIKANRYASPALIRDSEKIYLFVGQQDGGLLSYSAIHTGRGFPLFSREGPMKNIHVSNHSAPSAYLQDGIIEMSVGDYNGNLRHFACKKSSVEEHDR